MGVGDGCGIGREARGENLNVQRHLLRQMREQSNALGIGGGVGKQASVLCVNGDVCADDGG